MYYTGIIRTIQRYHVEGILFLLGTILSLVMLITIAVWGHPPSNYPVIDQKDSFEYLTATKNMLSGNGFTFSSSAPFIPESLRTPGYIVFAAFILGICKTLYAVSVVQAVLVGGMAVLIYRIALLFFNKKSAVITTLFSICNASLLFISTTFLTDTLFLFLILFSFYVWLIVFYERQHPSYIYAAAAGCLLGLATLVRPISQFLPIVYMIGAAFTYFHVPIRKLAFSFIIFALTYGGTVGPWMLYNDILYGIPTLTTNNSVIMLFYNIPITYADHFKIPINEAEEKFVPGPILTRWREGGQNVNELRQLYMVPTYQPIVSEYLHSHFLTYATGHLKRSLQFFTGNSFKPFMSVMGLDVVHTDVPTLLVRGDIRGALHAIWNDIKDGNIAIFISLLSATLWAFFLSTAVFGAVIGIFNQSLTLSQRGFIFFILGMIAYFAILSGTSQSMRLRLPAEPFIFMLSAAGILYCLKFIFKPQLRTLSKS